MKKIISIILCFALIATLNGCGFDGSNTNSDTQQKNEEEIIQISDKDADKMVGLINAVSKFENKNSSQQEIKEYLEEIDWIEEVDETEDGGVSCRTEFGVTGVWTPETENTIGNISKNNMPRNLVVPEATVPSEIPSDVESIAILCPYASEDSNFILDGYNYLGETMKKYTDCDFTFFKDEEVSLDLLKNLDDFDMVWFYSHGALSNFFNSAWEITNSDPYTMTGEFANSRLAYVMLSADFFFGRTVVNLSDGRIGVGGKFYQHYYSENELSGMFFHFASCNSMRTDKLAKGILSRGASWVEGWDNSVVFENDYMQFTGVIASLLEGDNINQAIKDADALVRKEYDFYQKDCKLKGLGDENYTLKIKDDFCKDLVGTYKGSYFATQGETGLTLTVFKEGEQYKALFDFYNLPGRSNAESGRYYMNVSYDIETDLYSFTSYEWIEKPETYVFADLQGKLDGDVLSGDSPIKFSLTKIDTSDVSE